MHPAPPLPAPAGVTHLAAAHLFDGAARDLVLRLKYAGRTYLAAPMADRMATALGIPPPVDVLVPIPLPPVRRILRGFNPAERLAAQLARRWNLKMAAGALRRRAGFPSQTRLRKEARQANALASFVIGRSGGVRGKRVLLVDDVSTTGATISACARILLQAGASTVNAAVFAWEPPAESDSVSGGS